MNKKTNQIKRTLAVTLTLVLVFSLSSVQFSYADVLFGGSNEKQIRIIEAEQAKAFFDAHRNEMTEGEWFYTGAKLGEGSENVLSVPDSLGAGTDHAFIKDDNSVVAVNYTIDVNGKKWGYVDFNSKYNVDALWINPGSGFLSGGWVSLTDLKETNKPTIAADPAETDNPSVAENPPLTEEGLNAIESNAKANNDKRVLFSVLAAIAVVAVILIFTFSGRHKRKSRN